MNNMKITIELYQGPNHDPEVTKKDIQRNIETIDRYLNGKQTANDYISLLDTQSILINIRKQLKD